MKNDLQRMTEDISKVYQEINDKTSSLGPIVQITRLYDELQGHLHGISIEEIESLENQVKSTLERLLTVSKSLNFLRAIKIMLDGQQDDGRVVKKI
jgi:hypothetical protein